MSDEMSGPEVLAKLYEAGMTQEEVALVLGRGIGIEKVRKILDKDGRP